MSDICPSCGKPIPPRPINREDIEDVVREEMDNLRLAIKNIKVPESAELSRQMDRVESLMTSHPVPNEALCCDIWGNCESCRPKLEEMANRGVFDQFKTRRTKETDEESEPAFEFMKTK